MKTLDERYTEWISRHVSSDPTGKCADITLSMAVAFPELRRVRGHYLCLITRREHPHWWMETSKGQVIDPTASQFPSGGSGTYIEHFGPEPTGKCPNCGGYVYDGGTVCGDVCARQYEAYVCSGIL